VKEKRISRKEFVVEKNQDQRRVQARPAKAAAEKAHSSPYPSYEPEINAKEPIKPHSSEQGSDHKATLYSMQKLIHRLHVRIMNLLKKLLSDYAQKLVKQTSSSFGLEQVLHKAATDMKHHSVSLQIWIENLTKECTYPT
jgi:hypothetical protein